MSQNVIKLSEWATKNDIHYKKAWRMFKSGQLPCRAIQYSTGTIHVFPDEPVKPGVGGRVAIYARTEPGHSEDRDDQLDRLRNFAASRGLVVSVEMWESGYGMDDSCEELCQILEDPTLTTIIVEHFDRLSWLGREPLDAFIRGSGRTLLVLNHEENKLTTGEFEYALSLLCSKFCPNSILEEYLYPKLVALVRDSRKRKIEIMEASGKLKTTHDIDDMLGGI